MIAPRDAFLLGTEGFDVAHVEEGILYIFLNRMFGWMIW